MLSYQSCVWNGFFKSNCVYLVWSCTKFQAQDFWLQDSRFKCSCIFIQLQQSLDRFISQNLRSIRRICPGVKKSLIAELETSAPAVGRYYYHARNTYATLTHSALYHTLVSLLYKDSLIRCNSAAIHAEYLHFEGDMRLLKSCRS
jgi:hypothetical protein